MALKIRLARAGAKKRPYYRVVVADSRMPRDGRFIERVGSYNPMVPKDHEDRLKLDGEKIAQWMGKGAQPTDRIARMLEAAGVREKAVRNNPNKAKPGQKATDRAEEKAARAAEAAEAAAAAAAAPAEEAPAEEAPAEEAAAEETAE